MKILIALCVILSHIWAFSVEDLSVIKRGNISGNFVQSKKMRANKNALVRHGSFSVLNGELFLDMTKPVISSIKITGEGIFVLQNGEWVQSEPDFNSALFFSIITLDFDAMRRDFELVLRGDIYAWNLVLLPKGAMKNAFRKIEISGGKYVERVILVESNGDITENAFSVR